MVFRGLVGFGEAFYFPALDVADQRISRQGNAVERHVVHQSSVYAGTITGGALTGYLRAQHYGWRLGFYVFGSLGVVLGVVLMFLLKEPETQIVPGEDGKRLFSLFREAWLEVFRNPHGSGPDGGVHHARTLWLWCF